MSRTDSPPRWADTMAQIRSSSAISSRNDARASLILICFWRRNSSRTLGFILQSYSASFTKVNSLTLFAVRLLLKPQKLRTWLREERHAHGRRLGQHLVVGGRDGDIRAALAGGHLERGH